MAETRNEEWRDVAGFDGLYMVSSLGNVRSVPRITQRSGAQMRVPGGLLELNVSRGYQRVNLRKNSQTLQRQVHHLVAEAFIGKRQPGQDTRHLDGNSLNNHVENIAYGSRSDNVQDAIRTKGLKTGSLSPNAKLTDEDIKRILEGSETAKQLASALEISIGHIAAIRQGRAWLHDAKGRKKTYKRVGSKSSQSKLTEEDVQKILESSKSSRSIAKSLGVDKAVICRIRNGTGWKHVARRQATGLDHPAPGQDSMVGRAAE